MFYCDDDAKRNGWPLTLFRSYGRCEVCRGIADCNSLPSSMLPDPTSKETNSKDGNVI
jgi:hypothetical protein